MENHYTAAFEHVGGWWIACVEEMPGPVAQEKTLEDARESLRKAVRRVLRANRDRARAASEGHDVIREPFAVDV